MAERKRLDVLLVERGLAPSREKAKAFVMAGVVYADGQKASKAGELYSDDVALDVRAASEFVSRGGYKLKKAMEVFGVQLNGKVCCDIGASTGGFSDCMLQNGAARVYAVDVGYGQLAWKIRSDPRVICLERTNARYLNHEVITEEADFASVDVSFISLKLVLPALLSVLSPDGEVVCLIKPQFEAGRENVGKKGVVRDRAIHESVIRTIVDFVRESGCAVLGLDYSPIKGPEGNIEYLLYFTKRDDPEFEPDISAVVNASHASLDR